MRPPSYRPAGPAGPCSFLEPCGVAGDVAARRAHVGLPAGVVRRATARVEADAGDHHVGVAGLGVDGHPLAGARVAPALEVARGQRLVEQPGAVQRVGDRARAVVARVVPLAVPAAVLVGLAGDLVARGDDRLDRVGRAGGRDGEAVGADLGGVAGRQLRGLGHGLRVGAGVVLAGQRAQGVDVGGVHDAVDGAVLRGLELLDRLLRGGAELAVDADLEAGAA